MPFCQPGRPVGFSSVIAKTALMLLVALAGISARAQTPPNTYFTNAIAINGLAGSTSENDVGATNEAGDPIVAGNPGPAAIVWYVWSPGLQDATVEFDTEGSDYDTGLGIYTSTSTNATLASLTLVSQNDDVNYPTDLTSRTTFTATAGTSYYIAVDGYEGATGNLVLNWSELTSVVTAGSFQFAAPTETAFPQRPYDPVQTNDGVFNMVLGLPLYVFSENESGLDPGYPLSSLETVMAPSPPRLTIARTGGTAGRVEVSYEIFSYYYDDLIYTNYFGTNFFMTNLPNYTNIYLSNLLVTNVIWHFDNSGFIRYSVTYTDIFTATTNINGTVTTFTTNLGTNFTAPFPCTNMIIADPSNMPPSNVVVTQYFCTNLPVFIDYEPSALDGFDFGPVSGVVDFVNFQSSVDVTSLVLGGNNRLSPLPPNRYLVALITGVQVAPGESQNLAPPTISTAGQAAIINVLNNNVMDTFSTAPPDPINTFLPTNSIVNFEKIYTRDWEGNGPFLDQPTNRQKIITVGVIRTGTNISSGCTVDYRMDWTPAGDNTYNTFLTAPGSDYATPLGSIPTSSQPFDFLPVTGTLTWGAGDIQPKFFSVTVTNDDAVEFNEDILLQLFNPTTCVVGQVPDEVCTILFDDQPAGAQDRLYNEDGNNVTDPPFNSLPGANGEVFALAVQPDTGSMLIAGNFSAYNTLGRNNIARVNTDGSIDRNFAAAPNQGANGTINCMALITNVTTLQNIMIGGQFTSYNGTNRYCLARLDTLGNLDATFNIGSGFTTAPGVTGQILAIVVQPDGSILVAGNFNYYNGTNCNNVTRLNSDGTLDTNFNVGIGPNGLINALGRQSDGKVIIGGQFTRVGSANYNYVARLNTNGTVDTTFSPGIGPDGPVATMAVLNDNRILIGGAFHNFDLISRQSLARMNADGSLDQSFDVGTGADDDIYTLMVYPTTDAVNGGKILIGGIFTSYNQTRRVGLARLFPDGSLDTTFMDTAYNQFAGLITSYYNQDLEPKNYLLTLGLQADGNVMIGGNFHQLGGDGAISFPGGTYTGTFAIGGRRDTIAPRANVTRVIGGLTPGPGNISFSYDSYSADMQGGGAYVTLVRTNGFGTNGSCLGTAAVTFNTAATGIGTDTNGVAVSGVDYTFDPTVYGNPTWPSVYEAGFTGDTWTVGDGTFGGNNVNDFWNGSFFGPLFADVFIIVNPTNLLNGNRTLNMGLSQPVGTLTLGGLPIPIGAALGSRVTAPMEIIDNYQPHGTFSFSSPTYTVNENAGTATINVVRKQGSQGAISVNYATVKGGSGVPGTTNDYISVSGKLTFANGITNLSFTVPIVNGSVFYPSNRTVNLQLSAITGGGLPGLTNAVLTIINDNFAPGQIVFTATNFTVPVSSPSATISVARTEGSVGVVTVYAATSNGSATNGINYNGVTNILTWTNGDVSVKYFTVPIVDDGLVATNRTVKLRLYSAVVNTVTNNTALLLGPTNATLTILNNNVYGSPTFSTSSYLANNNAGFATITVERLGGSAQTITVNYSTKDGTAVSGVHYGAVSGTLTFPPNVFTRTIIVPVYDAGQDISRFFSISLSNPTPTTGPNGGATLGFPNVASVTIVNSETYNQPPGGVDPIFGRYASFDNTVYSLFLQTNAQIIAAGDFSFADGVPRNRIARLNTDGTLDAKFSSPAIGFNASVRTVTVQTDNRIITGGLFTKANGVNNNYIARLNYDGTLDSTFQTGSGADNPVYAIAESFDTNSNRLILVGGSFVYFNGVPIQGLVRLLNNGVVDPSFAASGVNATVFAVKVYSTNDVINAGKIVIGGDFTMVNGVPRNHIARLNVDGTLDTTFDPGAGPNDSVRAIAIQVDGKLVLGGLFTSVAANSLSSIARLNPDGTVDSGFTPGPGANGAVLCLAIQEDQKIVAGGDFTRASGVTRSRLTRFNPDGTVDPGINFGTGANNSVSTVLIQPDDNLLIGGAFTKFNDVDAPYIARLFGRNEVGSGSVEFTMANFQVVEGLTNAVAVTLQRTGGTGDLAIGDVFITMSTSDGTGPGAAVAGVNYVPVVTNVDFPIGETFATVIVPIITNNFVDINRTFNLTLSNPVDVTLGNQPTAVVTIIDPNSDISFASATYSVNKNTVTGSASITLVRTGSTIGGAAVQFQTTTNGTANPVTDYTPITNTVIFADGQATRTTTVPIHNNGLVEGNKTVTLLLNNASNSFLISPSTATLTIVDNNTAPGDLMFAATNFTVSGTAPFAVINVIRTNGSANQVTVSYSVSGGSAIAGVDYTATNNSLTFSDGVTSQQIIIPIHNNPNLTSNVTVNVTLSNPTGGATILGPTTVPLTILDMNVGLAFAQPGYFVNETNGSITIGVSRIGNTNGVFTVQFATVNGTATAGVNFTNTSGVLSFGAGETFQTFAIPIIHDPDITGNLAFFVSLSNPSGSSRLIQPSTTVVTIIDDDTGVSFGYSTKTITKSPTNVVVPVIRQGNTVGAISVNFATTGGSAVAGVEYIATNGTLFFLDGQTSNSFSIPIINDNQIDGTTTVNFALSNPSAGVKLLPPTTGQLVIVDNESGLSLSSPAYTVTEDGVAATITVIRTGITNNTVSVNYATRDGSATNGIQYTGVGGTLTFTNGQVSQSFSVPIIDNNVTGGSETVLISISGASGNAILVSPTSATLTIFNNDGSRVIPAGSAVISESGPVNGAIDPGEKISLLLALRNVAGSDTVNLNATLLATNGITPSATNFFQNYGVVVTNGPSVSRLFTFTANGTNGSVVRAVLQLKDGNTALGTATFNYTLGTVTNSFTNSAVITINDANPASPYPSTISIAGLNGQVTKVTATLHGLNHGSVSDVAVLLQSPSGTNELLMGNVGGPNAVSNLRLTFDPTSSNVFTTNAPVSGTYEPTQLPFPNQGLTAIPFPASTNGNRLLGAYGTNLSAFIGSPLNGTWSLYVLDDVSLFSGTISNGWSLNLNTLSVVLPTVDLAVGMTASPGVAIINSNVTYTINVTNAGPSTATGIWLTNSLPAGLTFASSASGTYSASANAVIFNVGTLPINGTATLTEVLTTTAIGPVTNSVSAGSVETDADPDNNIAAATVIVSASAADLAVSMSDSPDPVLVGNTLLYSITVNNLGPATATSVVLTDTLPAGAILESSSASYTLANGVLTANLGSIGNGGSVVVSVVVRPTVAGTLTNSVGVATTVPDPFKSNNNATVKSVAQWVPLSVSRGVGGILFAWPVANGYTLESATNLLSPVWVPVTNAVQTFGGTNSVNVPFNGGTEFFRLAGTVQ